MKEGVKKYYYKNMSNLIGQKAINNVAGDIPEMDDFYQVVISKQSSKYVARKLVEQGMCAISVAVGQSTMYRMMFVYMPKARESFLGGMCMMWEGGGDLFVAIEGKGAYSFNSSLEIHPDYVKSKLGNYSGKQVIENIGHFVQDIANEMNLLIHRKALDQNE